MVDPVCWACVEIIGRRDLSSHLLPHRARDVAVAACLKDEASMMLMEGGEPYSSGHRQFERSSI
jgi:hypothetical protein